MSGKTVAVAAAAAGMSERTARQWQSGALPSTAKAPRTWRTREDPFAEVWESEVVPQLVADTDSRLQVLALFKALCRRHPGRFQSGQLRTLQRRVREWRVQDGPDREVYFEQVAVPGREAAFDFTDGSDLGVTLRGVPFPHLLFEWVLSYSKWTYVALAVSETFEALVAGLQGALWTLGAVPAVLRHDNLSAATHELKRSGGRQLTARFQQVMDHYGLDSSRIQPGKPHENGVAEQAHFRTKTAIEQALLLRGGRKFDDESSYLRYVQQSPDEAEVLFTLLTRARHSAAPGTPRRRRVARSGRQFPTAGARSPKPRWTSPASASHGLFLLSLRGCRECVSVSGFPWGRKLGNGRVVRTRLSLLPVRGDFGTRVFAQGLGP